MIEVFKIMVLITFLFASCHVNTATRGNKYKLYRSSVKYDLRKHFLLTELCLYGTVYYIVVDSESI